ncbi:GntR family transcriptional regulator [Ruegeria sp. 2012CJ41-6]|uniref:GntR family transcriptional regulator n=1 Tax=Ruegeria spongiae TaxID=2942209 RepID=A0ABT0Q0F1_9RHOB|nr:GntR family transcriptional regulator [Ruegeria spongiae]MCL6283263.1 GntR family transcriptional regulator [Ruegeria spongiae]
MTTSPSLHDTLRDRVVNGEFAPGQRLRPEALRKDYDCSASAVRESLFRLSTVGLVDFQEQRGFRIPQRSPTLQHDLTQFRILLESEGACRSVRNGGVAWEARLAAAHHKLSHIESRIGDDRETSMLLTLWTEAELEFHQTLIEACGSDILKQTHARIYQQFRQQMISSDREFAYIAENVEEHRSILEAALAHDEALLRQRIHDHLSRNLLPKNPGTAEA